MIYRLFHCFFNVRTMFMPIRIWPELRPRVWCNSKTLSETNKRTRVRIPLGTNILEIDFWVCINYTLNLPSRQKRGGRPSTSKINRAKSGTWIIKKKRKRIWPKFHAMTTMVIWLRMYISIIIIKGRHYILILPWSHF